MSRLSDPDFEPDDIAKEMRERLRLEHFQQNKWHLNCRHIMRRNGHIVSVATWKNIPRDIGETIYWLDGTEVRRDAHYSSPITAEAIAANIIAAMVAEVQP